MAAVYGLCKSLHNIDHNLCHISIIRTSAVQSILCVEECDVHRLLDKTMGGGWVRGGEQGRVGLLQPKAVLARPRHLNTDWHVRSCSRTQKAGLELPSRNCQNHSRPLSVGCGIVLLKVLM